MPVRERVALWLHLQMCHICRGFTRHLKLFREASKLYAQELESDQNIMTSMPEDVRRRIRDRLAQIEP